MNNLHRELAPISAAAWADIEAEARRTFKRQSPAAASSTSRQPDGAALAAVATGHLDRSAARPTACIAHCGAATAARRAAGAVHGRAGDDVDDVERGAKDADWQPVKDAARPIAFAEDRAVFEGYPAAGIAGMRAELLQPGADPARRRPGLPERGQPGGERAAAARASSGPYTLLLSAERLHRGQRDLRPRLPDPRAHRPRARTARSSGRPRSTARSCCRPAAATSSCTSARTCRSATSRTTPDTVQLYFQESLTFLVYTTEATVSLAAGTAPA